jgi:pSer/pThr/pTyr-binding forkhead associated (FHA) protein
MPSKSTPFLIDLDAEAHERDAGPIQTPRPSRHGPAPDQSLDSFRQACGVGGPLRLDLEYPIGRPPIPTEFAPPFVLVGRDTAADLNLDDSAVSRRHAFLQVIDGHVFAVDLGSRTGLLWGNQSRRAGWLAPGQALDIGPFALRLPDGAAGPVPDWDPLASRKSNHDPLPAVELEILTGSRKGTRGRMNRVFALMGHAPECRARLAARNVSRYHCGLLRTPRGTWVVDLLTAHGTHVNETRVRWAKLADGDELRVGEVRFGVRYRSAAKAGAPGLRTLSDPPAEEPRTPVEVEPLRTRIAELEQTATAARERAETERQARERIEAEVAETRARLAESEQRLAVAEQAHAQRETERASARQALATAEQDRDAARSEADHLRARLADAERAAAEASERAAAGRAALDAARVEIEQLQAWVSELEVARAESLAATQSREAEAAARVRELEQALAERDRAHESAASAERREREQVVAALRAELQSARAAAERERQSAEAARAQWEAERADLRNEIARFAHEHEQIVANLRAKSEADRAAVAQLQARAEEWERLATDHDRATTQARSQIAKLEQAHAAAAQTHAQLETERTKLQESLAALEHERQAAESARTQWEAERASLQNEIARLAREQEQILAARRAESEARRAAIEQLQAQAAEWERAAKDHEHAATEARARLADLEQAHTDAAQTHAQRETERTKLQQSLTALERDRDATRSELNQLRSRLAELEQAAADAREQAETERTNREETRREMERFRTGEQQAQARVRELEQAIAGREQAREAEAASGRVAQGQWEAERANLRNEIARLKREVAALRDGTRLVEPTPRADAPRRADDEQTLGRELRFGDLGVTPSAARVRAYTSTTAAGRKMTHEPALVVELALTNHNPEQTLTAHGQARSARLEDSTGRAFRALRATNELGLENAIDGQIRSGAGREVLADADERDVLVFEPPGPDAGDLVLILDAAKYGGTGSVRVRIPQSAWQSPAE